MKSRVIAIAALATLFSGCNLNPIPSFRVSTQLESVSFTGEITKAGILKVNVEAQPKVVFSAEPGSVGGVVQSYSVEVVNGAGQSVTPGAISADNQIGSQVAPGRTCKEGTGYDCIGQNATEVRYTPGQPTTPVAINAIGNDTGFAFLRETDSANPRTPPSDWKVNITFKYKDDNGFVGSFVVQTGLNCNCTIRVND
jgi:hypothetical protein